MVIVKRTHSAALRMYFNMIELCDLSELNLDEAVWERSKALKLCELYTAEGR